MNIACFLAIAAACVIPKVLEKKPLINVQMLIDGHIDRKQQEMIDKMIAIHLNPNGGFIDHKSRDISAKEVVQLSHDNNRIAIKLIAETNSVSIVDIKRSVASLLEECGDKQVDIYLLTYHISKPKKP